MKRSEQQKKLDQFKANADIMARISATFADSAGAFVDYQETELHNTKWTEVEKGIFKRLIKSTADLYDEEQQASTYINTVSGDGITIMLILGKAGTTYTAHFHDVPEVVKLFSGTARDTINDIDLSDGEPVTYAPRQGHNIVFEKDSFLVSYIKT